ncbi:predicted protein [Streptomyces viridosporus ATCC 14672]|uniref:Predicted protein n=1 Tax=Streptomyces viridosporus (strain ATCC 14672 / DSM 40746 / JCM 4963 / KCTC 9882 / NRRL B-12104 / FH 1290) TaxID=566461 RepID=D5ZU39_STRV1|nr:predicted protein [Streptomyces viridosporus ATCC 14672]
MTFPNLTGRGRRSHPPGFGRYALTTSAGGVSPTFGETARHVTGVPAHELGAITNQHLSVGRSNEAITDAGSAFTCPDPASSSAAGVGTRPVALSR